MPWILDVRRVPALYTREDVKHRLNLGDDDAVSKLVDAGLLRPLGERQGKQQMYFWAEEIEEKIRDRRWMERVVICLQGPKKSQKESTDIRNK